jgi:hypothetical protein
MAGWDNPADKYLASQPMRIHFAGWETDTYRLQQNGWQLSASQDPYNDSIQVAFQHAEYRMRGVTNRIRRYDMMDRYSYNQFSTHKDTIDVAAFLASDFVSTRTNILPMESFKPIDAEPQFMEMRQMMSQNMFFAPNLARTQELIVPEQSVDDLLNMILDKQASNRAQLIQRRVREQGQKIDFNPRTHVHAQIVSIAA